MSRREAATFYLLVPACIGLLLGWGHAGQVASQLPHFLSILYWIGLAILIWTLNDPATRLVSLVLAPALKRILLVSLLGGLLATLAQRPLVLLYSAGFVQAAGIPAPDFVQDVGWGILPHSLRGVSEAIAHCAEWIGLWVICNWTLVSIIGKPRFGTIDAVRNTAPILPRTVESVSTLIGIAQPAGDPIKVVEAGRPELPILSRTRRDLGPDVLVLQAQDHFVRVTTPLGSELVLYRFNDAIREMGRDAGLQVHRSYWVARDAVRALSESDGQCMLELTNGTRIPVSRARRQMVKHYFPTFDRACGSGSAAARQSRIDRVGKHSVTVAVSGR